MEFMKPEYWDDNDYRRHQAVDDDEEIEDDEEPELDPTYDPELRP